MPTSVGPNTKGEENLVFGYDLGDVSNSYKGEPTTNYLVGQGWWGDGSNQTAFTKGVASVTDPALTYKGYNTVLWSPGTSLNCYLHDSADIPPSETSTVWTFSCYIRREDGGTLRASDNSLAVYLYYPGSDGNATGDVTYMGDGWYRVSRTRTGAANYISLAGFTGFAANYKYYLSGWMLEKKSHPTPSIPINTTRSATQGLQDLTGNSTIDLTNVSFDSNAQMTFDGTNDYINLNSIAPLIAGGDFSLEAIIKGPAQDHKGIIPINTSTGGNRALFLIRNASMGIYDGNTWYIGNIDVDDNNWHHVTLSYTRSTRNAVIYVDGEVSLNTTTGNTITVASDDKISVGQEYDGASTSDHFNGQIPIAKIYNRALTASEVQSNYKAVKSRFNI